MTTPEKLNLWDRFFNRYRKQIVEEGTEIWHNVFHGYSIPNSDFERKFVKYKITDRLTGSETLEKIYFTKNHVWE